MLSMSYNQEGIVWVGHFDRHYYYYLVSQCCSTEVWPQPECKAVQWLISSAASVTAFLLTSKPLPDWREAGTGWTCTSCCSVMKPTWLAAQQNGHCLSKCLQLKKLPALSHLKKEDLWWAALQMEKLSIGIELNKYSSLNVSKMPPPAQPRKRRKPAWEPAHNLVWGCLRQEWSLICCHFPYTGHHGKIKWQK